MRMEQAHRPLSVARLQFFDIETTGLRPDRGAKITEVAVVRRGHLRYAWALPEPPERGGNPLAAQLPELLGYLSDGVVVGHHLAFDFRFVAYEAERRGLAMPTLRYIDTLGLARRLLGRACGVRLGALLDHFALAPEGPLHTAETDARATEALFWKLCKVGELRTLADAGMKPLRWATH